MAGPINRSEHQGTRALLCAAALVVLIAGLKASATLLLPIIVALFLSLLCVPPMRWLCHNRPPVSL